MFFISFFWEKKKKKVCVLTECSKFCVYEVKWRKIMMEKRRENIGSVNIYILYVCVIYSSLKNQNDFFLSFSIHFFTCFKNQKQKKNKNAIYIKFKSIYCLFICIRRMMKIKEERVEKRERTKWGTNERLFLVFFCACLLILLFLCFFIVFYWIHPFF